MYVLALNQTVQKFPYSIGDLKSDNPQTSFPANPTEATLASFNVFPVVSIGVQYDLATQIATQDGCVFNAQLQRWETTWSVRDKTAEELADYAAKQTARIDARRAEAYRNEADPLFFKLQRGEVSVQTWLDKVAEIKARYPN